MQGSPSKKKPHPHRVQRTTAKNSKRRAALLAIIAAAGAAIFAALFLASFSSSDAPQTTNKHAKSIPSYILNYTGPTVVWENRTSFPCHPGESNWGAKSTQNIPTTKGLLYTKPLKVRARHYRVWLYKLLAIWPSDSHHLQIITILLLQSNVWYASTTINQEHPHTHSNMPKEVVQKATYGHLLENQQKGALVTSSFEGLAGRRWSRTMKSLGNFW